MMPDIEILDCTLRDGSYPLNYFYSLRDTQRICEALEISGVKKIEVGHGMGLGASLKGFGDSAHSDLEYIESAARTVNSSHIGVFAIPGIAERQHIIDAKKAGITFLRIGTDVDKIETAHELIETAISLDLDVSLNIMKSYARPKEELLERIERLGTSSLDVISIVDSAGTMVPMQVQQYVGFLVENLQNKIGFHGHNNLQLAIANSLAAVQGGAKVIDATLRGIGRSSGNAQVEVLVPVLERSGYLTQIDYKLLSDFSDVFYEPPYPKYGIQGIELACGVFGLHSSFLPKVVAEANSLGVDVVKLIEAITLKDQINVDVFDLNKIATSLPKANWIPVNAEIHQSNKLEALDDLLDALITYATKFNKKTMLTLSSSGSDFNRIPRITFHDDLVIGHAEVSNSESKILYTGKLKELDYLGLDRKLLEINSDLNESNLFVYDEMRIVDVFISEILLNFGLLQGRYIIETIGDRPLTLIDRPIINHREFIADKKSILFVTSKLSDSQVQELKDKKASKIIFLHPDYMPSNFQRDADEEIYRLDTRHFFDLHVIGLARQARQFGGRNISSLGGVNITSGGYIAPRGTLVLDDLVNPTRLLGVASGFGTLLSKKDELEFKSDIEAVNLILLESKFRLLRSGD